MGDLILNITALVTDVAAAKREAEAELAAAAEFEAARDDAERKARAADRKARAARTRGETILHVLAAKAALEDASGTATTENGHNGVPHADKPKTAPDALTGRASVLKVINDGDDDTEWSVKSVSEALGVSPDDEGKVATSLQRLASGFNGTPPQIARPRRGVYKKLLPVSVASEPGEDQRVNSDGGPQLGAGSAASTFEFR